MPTGTRVKHLTFEEFCILVKEGQKADLIKGVMYVASPDNRDANDIFVWLISLFHDFVELYDLDKVYGSRVAFRLGDKEGPEPDIGFVRKKRLGLVKRGHVVGPPDIAVEIVSPESIDRDYKQKRAQYQEAGVPEYWIVDEITETVTLLRPDARGKYREVRPRKGKLHSEVLPGFWIRPEWLWPQTRPRKTEALAQILASPAAE